MPPIRARAGLLLPARKQSTCAQAIETAPAPDQVVLPLNQHGGAALRATVQTGDHVLLGQVIAEPANDLEAALHASVSGRVLSIEPRPSAKPFSEQALSIVIGNDYTDAVHPDCRPNPDWSTLTPLDLCRRLARGGIVGLGGAVFSTATKLAAHDRLAIDTLIVNGVECEPYITCDDRLMRERAREILQGVQILLHASQAQCAVIGIESDKPEAIAAMRASAQQSGDARVQIEVVPHAYPVGDEGQLIAELLGREIPRGALPADVGVVVQNVATAFACARWILAGEPLISRVVTLAGSGIDRPRNVEVRIGSSMDTLLKQEGEFRSESNRLVMGGPMMGVSLSHARYPVTKATNSLIVATAVEFPSKPPEQPCIRCAECMHVCPVGLLPQQLLAHARHGQHKALEELGLQDCIECGCCDYVCPSHIRLASLFHETKASIAQEP